MKVNFFNHFYSFFYNLSDEPATTILSTCPVKVGYINMKICALQERIFAFETEMGLQETLPMESSGEKWTFTSKEKGEKTATYNLKLNDTVSFPRPCKDTYNELGAKPKKFQLLGSTEDM